MYHAQGLRPANARICVPMSGSCGAVSLCTDLHIGNDCDNRQFGLVNQIVIMPNADSALVMTASAAWMWGAIHPVMARL